MRSSLKGQRASILIVVLVTLMVASLALVIFMGKASDDLLIEVREADARRLRSEAYSALETVVAVLVDFKTVNRNLRSPSEGWGDPLTWAGYTPEEGRIVKVEFKDESGKISLPRATEVILKDLFVSWEIPQTDAERLADALLYWISHEHTLSSGITPTYDLGTMPFEPPGRSLRSWGELAAIDVVRDIFFEEDGRPNALWKRFTDSVSLLNFNQTNINAATPDVLTAMGFDLNQQTQVNDYLKGLGVHQSKGPGYFRSTADIASIAGKDATGLTPGTDIRALRVIITVQDGRSIFRLNTLLTTGNNSAAIVTTKATPKQSKGESVSSGTSQTSTRQVTGSNSSPSSSSSTRTASSTTSSITYPFVVLEMRENDEIASIPADPAVSP